VACEDATDRTLARGRRARAQDDKE